MVCCECTRFGVDLMRFTGAAAIQAPSTATVGDMTLLGPSFCLRLHDQHISSELLGTPSIPSNGATQQALSGPPGFVQYPPTQQNGTSPTSVTEQPQQLMPQYPPGVKPRPSETPPPGLATAPQQQVQGTRPTSAAAQQMLPQQARPSVASGFPGSLSDLVASFENVKQKGQLSSNLLFVGTMVLTCRPLFVPSISAPHRMSNLDQVHKLLEGSYSSMPQPQDTEKYVVCQKSISTVTHTTA